MAQNGPKWQKWPETAKTAKTAGRIIMTKRLSGTAELAELAEEAPNGQNGPKRSETPPKAWNSPKRPGQARNDQDCQPSPASTAQPSPVHLASPTRPASTRCHRDRLPAGYSVRSIPPYLRHEAATCKSKPKRQKGSRASTRGGLLPNRPNQAQEEPRFNTQRTLTPQSSPEQSK